MGLIAAPQQARIRVWLKENSELLCELYIPRSGGSGTQYLMRSIEDLEDLVSKQSSRRLTVRVLRRDMYPLRGVSDETLLEKALDEFREGETWSMCSPDHYYPEEIWLHASGESHAELRAAFAEFTGHRISLGRNPFNSGEDDWTYETPDEAMVINVRRRFLRGYVAA